MSRVFKRKRDNELLSFEKSTIPPPPNNSRYTLIPDPITESKLRPVDKQNDDNDNDSPWPRNNNHLQGMIVAKRRSGKTTIIHKLLTEFYNKHFTNVYMVSPSAEHDDKLKEIVKMLKERCTFYNECSADVIKEILADCEENIKLWRDLQTQYEIAKKDPYRKGRPMPKEPEEPKHLLILDDCVDKFGAHSDTKHPLVKVSNNSYHCKLSVWIAAHKFRHLLPPMRSNLDWLTLFRICNNKEKKAIEEEINCPMDVFRTCYKDAVSQPYGFLHIHWVKGGLPSLFNRHGRYDVPLADILFGDDDDDGTPPQVTDQHVEGKLGKKRKLALKDDVDLSDYEEEFVDLSALAHTFQ